MQRKGRASVDGAAAVLAYAVVERLVEARSI